ncbi:MAG: 50S ribosomal protein L23 [Rhodocyclaceae bacterium]
MSSNNTKNSTNLVENLQQVRKERLYQVLLAPQISEKSTMVADKRNQVVFKVASDATKPEIKQAVEFIFNVKVNAVQISNVKGKVKRFRGHIGQRSGWKKAFICLQAGQEINFAEGGEA